MASWAEKNDPSGENLRERLDRTRDLAARQPGEYGMGGWHRRSQTIAPPDPPSLFLVLLPFIVLLLVTAAVMIGLSLVGGL